MFKPLDFLGRLHHHRKLQPQFVDTLGKLLDRLGRYDEAFESFAEANALDRASCDIAKIGDEIDCLIAAFAVDVWPDLPRAKVESERPVFIVGMPRSGTTPTEQILPSHPEVAAAGELVYLDRLTPVIAMELGAPWPQVARQIDAGNAERYWRPYLELLERHSATARLVTDKLPGNFMHLGLIRLLFPEAPVIHCRRDPLDTCLSNFFQQFQEGLAYSFDLLDTGHYYLQYRRLMEHWRAVLPGGFLDSDYEALVADPEGRSRALVTHCGLEWNETCLAPHELKREVKTASNWQVRQPIYQSSARRWKRYEKYLGDLKAMLGYREAE